MSSQPTGWRRSSFVIRAEYKLALQALSLATGSEVTQKDLVDGALREFFAGNSTRRGYLAAARRNLEGGGL